MWIPADGQDAGLKRNTNIGLRAGDLTIRPTLRMMDLLDLPLAHAAYMFAVSE